MTFESISQKIASKYIDKNQDMNESIAKYASENNLNLEKTKRLVEECNKSCYLQKLASTGEQIFDVAVFDKVKDMIQTKEEVIKTAANINFEINYDEPIEKNASEKEYTLSEINETLDECDEIIGRNSNKLYEMQKQASYKNISEEEITKVAEEIEKYNKIKDIVLEKKAGIISGIAGTGLKVGSKVVSTAATHPMKTLTAVGAVGTFKQGMKKVKPEDAQQFIGNITKTAGFLSDLANFAKSNGMKNGMKTAIENAMPMLAIGTGVGLATVAAKNMGGLASKMMGRHDLNQAFDTIEQAHEDIRDMPNARDYYNVIARHSPSLALDPMVAPQLIRQFNMFGGVDVNTVGKLREIENTGASRPSNAPGFIDTTLNTASGLMHLQPSGYHPIQNRNSYTSKELEYMRGIIPNRNKDK